MTSLFESPSSPPLATRTGGTPASQRPNRVPSDSLLTQSAAVVDQVRSSPSATSANSVSAKSSGPRPLLAQARSQSGSGGASAGLSSNRPRQLLQRYERNLGPREGGTANRPLSSDPAGLTHKGISQRFLDRLRKNNPKLGLPADPRQLSPKQRSEILKREFFDRANVPKVAAVPGVMRQASKLPEQLFDSAVQHGPERAGKLLQESLDKVLGTDLRITKNGKKEHDGIVGPKTRSAIAEAVRRNKLRDVNNEMAVRRERFMRGRSNFKPNPGWIPRARSFLMP